MSGGALTDYHHDLFRMGEWAQVIERENPLLAEQMKDMCKLLGRYDYYLSGDIGEDSIEKAWSEYRDKWIGMDSTSAEHMMCDICIEIVRDMVRGYRKDDKSNILI